MASYSWIFLAIVIICACEEVASIRPSGGAAQYKVAEPKQEISGHKKAKGGWGAMWMHAEGASRATLSNKATWKQEIGCSPCEEVYVVRDEGETLQTISEKCHAPFILLDNPHVQDTDDISAGSVLLISSTHLPC